MSKQVQTGGDHSTNVQAAEVTIHHGPSYQEIRQIAQDVFKANYYQLAGKAAKTATKRAEEVTDRFLARLQTDFPQGFAKADDPDFQHALFTVQKEHARAGDANLADLLVDILIDRSKCLSRDLIQIVLNESLEIAPKLTTDQIVSLSMSFLFKYTQNYGVVDLITLGAYFDKFVKPFINDLTKKPAAYQHLEFSGCAKIDFAGSSLEATLGRTYQGLFMKGFSHEELSAQKLNKETETKYVVPCLNDPGKLQISKNSEELLKEQFEKDKLPSEIQKPVLALFNTNKMSEPEIKTLCITSRPYMDSIFDIWSNSLMQRLTLSSVGIAIGHANIQRIVGPFGNLSIWIN